MQVLFIEDDPMNRRIVKDMLCVAGAEMAEASDAITGLKMLDEGDYEVLLVDLRMPGMDGFEAIRRIRSRDDHKALLPIIVVTADAGRTIEQDCLDCGADAVLLKPVAMKQLFETMARLLVEGARRRSAA